MRAHVPVGEESINEKALFIEMATKWLRLAEFAERRTHKQSTPGFVRAGDGCLALAHVRFLLVQFQGAVTEHFLLPRRPDRARCTARRKCDTAGCIGRWPCTPEVRDPL